MPPPLLLPVLTNFTCPCRHHSAPQAPSLPRRRRNPATLACACPLKERCARLGHPQVPPLVWAALDRWGASQARASEGAVIRSRWLRRKRSPRRRRSSLPLPSWERVHRVPCSVRWGYPACVGACMCVYVCMCECVYVRVCARLGAGVTLTTTTPRYCYRRGESRGSKEVRPQKGGCEK